MSWRILIQPKSGSDHKYAYGHVVVYGGARMTGAAGLAAVAALRMGAGLVTIAAPRETTQLYRELSPSVILEERTDFKKNFEDERRNAIVIGPGAGSAIKKAVLDSAKSQKLCVLDADALTAFEDEPEKLLKTTHSQCVLTPHEGEFARLFPDISGPRAGRAINAAKQSGAIMVLKGAETVVASPDGRVERFVNGSAWLATAGSGDVLAGMIAGFGAWHRENLFEAVCAAVWMHGEASQIAGPGMISSDLPGILPEVWRRALK